MRGLRPGDTQLRLLDYFRLCSCCVYPYRQLTYLYLIHTTDGQLRLASRRVMSNAHICGHRGAASRSGLFKCGVMVVTSQYIAALCDPELSDFLPFPSSYWVAFPDTVLISLTLHNSRLVGQIAILCVFISEFGQTALVSCEATGILILTLRRTPTKRTSRRTHRFNARRRLVS